ncbi:LysR substrate-binding domain-containing protein [Palleronia sp. LCG004]|uniref:LysR substrate-binding domain-containing protein n=1 Tax=Palleronia sp. LCG004 TaxID=3079304 RepID=UPI002941C1F8|nr:LysR substrate-binding domain-containing protein [Palleronia sp. LCG004]WOI56637.1 LysR substrate-binding domain-containing protein [Palleronia sp. LCG004]
MHRLRRKIPSLSALISFEAAARCESFTRAADELGVSQAAVSRRIKTLEDEIGVALFTRANRHAYLTEEGARLYAAVIGAFDGLADAVEATQAPRVDLTVAVSVAFGHFRLLPALSAFRESAPSLGLRVISEDIWNAPRDRQIDVAVRYGRPPFAGMTVVGSLREAIVPVCAPDLARQLAGITFAELAGQGRAALIDSDAPEPSWLDWTRFLKRSGWSGPMASPRLRFSSYSDSVFAAINGQGVALGWTGLLERPLSDGRLEPLDLPALWPEERQYIVVPDHGRRTYNADVLIDWMEKTFRLSDGR